MNLILIAAFQFIKSRCSGHTPDQLNQKPEDSDIRIFQTFQMTSVCKHQEHRKRYWKKMPIPVINTVLFLTVKCSVGLFNNQQVLTVKVRGSKERWAPCPLCFQPYNLRTQTKGWHLVPGAGTVKGLNKNNNKQK